MLQPTILFKTRTAIRSLVNPQRQKKLSVMVLFSLFSALLDVFGVAILVYIIHFITNREIQYTTIQLTLGASAVIIFFLIKNGITTYLTRLQASFAFSEALIQSNILFKNVYNQNELFFRGTETGALISDIMYVPSAFANGVILGYITMLTELCVLILMLLFLAFTSFYICMLALLFVAPASFFSYRSIKNKVEELGHLRNRNVKKAQDALIQSVHAHTDAVMYNRKEYFGKLFSSFQAEISSTDASVFTLNSIPPRLMELFAVVAFCLIYIYNKRNGSESSLPFNITLFVAAAFRLLPSVNRSLGSMLRIKNHWFAVDVLSRYKKTNKEEQESGMIHFTKNITLKDIKFSFGGNTICDIDSFSITKGSCIGIYGNTGEGKSTFLQLLLQLIPVDKGIFFVDDAIVEKKNSLSYNRLFAYIKQDVFILNASMQENISLSKEDECNIILLNEIIAKLELDKIKHLFKEENIKAGEAGNKLSGGQKKLVALARALYFEKPVIVLDEALASLDNETTRIVLEVLKQEHKKGKTIIIVSHQKNVFEICDTIYEFKNRTLFA